MCVCPCKAGEGEEKEKWREEGSGKLGYSQEIKSAKTIFCFWKERVIVPGLLSPTA